MVIKNLNLKEAFQLIACDKPAPGGGSVAALACGLAASLTRMVASITMGKQRHREWHDEMKMIAGRAGELMAQSLDLADEDSRSYQEVLAAMRMPKGTAHEALKRQNALQLAFKNATGIPLKVCRASVEILEQCISLSRHGIESAAADVMIASITARAAFDGSIAVIHVNLPGAADETYSNSVKKELEELKTVKDQLANQMASTLKARLGL